MRLAARLSGLTRVAIIATTRIASSSIPAIRSAAEDHRCSTAKLRSATLVGPNDPPKTSLTTLRRDCGDADGSASAPLRCDEEPTTRAAWKS